jgi:TonB family protein
MHSPFRRWHITTAALALSITAAYHAPVFAATICETPTAPASPIVSAVPDIPAIAYSAQQVTGTTDVEVDLDPSGRILNASVLKSSGTPFLDRAAMEATRASTFRPEIRDCVTVGGSYIFIVDFPKD